MALTPEERGVYVELGLNEVSDSDMLHIVRDMADPTRLPEGWSMHLHPDSGRHFYVSSETQESTWEHPLLRFYLGYVFMERGGEIELEHNADHNPPTDDEIAAMAEYLEIRPTEAPTVVEVARLACCAPYPAGWVEERDESGEVMFRNVDTGEVSAQHPLDDYFMELARRRRAAAKGTRPILGAATANGAPAAAGPGPSLPPAARSSVAAAPQTPTQTQTQNHTHPPQTTAAPAPSVHAAPASGSAAREPEAHAAPPLPAGPASSEPDRQARASLGPGGRSLGAQEERIRVVIRARPLERKKATPAWRLDPGGRSIAFAPDVSTKHATSFYANQEGTVQKPGPGTPASSAPPTVPPTAYKFDAVCGPEATSYEVYHTHIRDIVKSALDGVNGTVFAYGQTGSGKTFTIVGKKAAPGLLMLAADDMFEQITQRQANAQGDFSVRCAMIELYNEELNDLLVPPGQKLTAGVGSLKIKDDPVMGIKVVGLHEEAVNDAFKVKMLLDRGMARRVVAQTKMNDASSRSHTIFRITIENHTKLPGQLQGTIRSSTLNFVDLAGSERLDKTGSEGIRAQESANINLSLFMLGNVISKLSEGRSAEFVPYRNSKLTRILQPSLGGNARAAIVATVSVSHEQAEETSHTLRFAARAANVKNRVSVNEMVSDEALIKRYKAEIDTLQRQLQGAQNSDVFFENERLKQKVAELTDENERLKVGIERARAFGAHIQVDGGGRQGVTYLDETPSTPPDLSLPQVGGNRGANLNSKDALSAIHRIVQMGKRGAAASAVPQPGEIVQAIRVMRAERDELRKKLSDARESMERQEGHVSDSHKILTHWRSMEDAVRILEDLVGGPAQPMLGSQAAAKPGARGKAPEALPREDQLEQLPSRLREAVEACVLLQAELASLQRQYNAGVALLKEEEGRRKALNDEIAKLRQSDKAVLELEKEVGALSLQAATLQRQRDEIAGKVGLNPATLPQPGGEIPGERAMRFADLIEQKLKISEDKHRAELAERAQELERHKTMIREYLGIMPAMFNANPKTAHGEPSMDAFGSFALVGSAAVRAAREAKNRAARAENRAIALETENASLRERVAAIEAAAASRSKEEAAAATPASKMGTGSDAAALGLTAGDATDPQALIDKLKKRVYSLSKEVAALSRERDELLQRLAGTSAELGGMPVAAMQMMGGANRRANGPATTDHPVRANVFPPLVSELRARKATSSGRRQIRSSSAALGASTNARPAGGWVDHVSGAEGPVEEIRALKRRLVASEKAQRDLLQQKQSEVRNLQLRSTQVERSAQEAQALLEQLAAENARLKSALGGR